MSITTSTTPTDGMVLYYPIIEIWSGTVKVQRDIDLANASDSLPPSEILSDGRKRLVPTDPLKPLLNVRKNVDRLLRRIGFPFMGGIAIPESATALVEAELPKLEQTFKSALDALCSDLDNWYEKLEADFPDWASILRASRLSPSEVRGRCKFDIAAFKAATPDAGSAPRATARFGRFADEAFPNLLKDISTRAEAMLEGSFSGRTEVTQRQVTPVRKMIEKLGTFSFLDPRVLPMSEALASQLSLIPATGPLDASQTSMVVSMLRMMSDPATILASGEAFIKQASSGLPALQSSVLDVPESSPIPASDENQAPKEEESLASKLDPEPEAAEPVQAEDQAPKIESKVVELPAIDMEEEALDPTPSPVMVEVGISVGGLGF